jgi:hypothetical protein
MKCKCRRFKEAVTEDELSQEFAIRGKSKTENKLIEAYLENTKKRKRGEMI